MMVPMRPTILLFALLAACGSVDNNTANTCKSPSKICDGSCTNVQSDNENCGACGTVCEAGDRCDGTGQCAPTCAAGTELCNGECVDVTADSDNCGACGNVCPGGQRCNGMGVCAATCEPSFLSCGGKCIDPTSNDSYCGATADCAGANAGTDCTTSNGVCSNSVCKPLGVARYEGYWTTTSTTQQCTDYNAWKTRLATTMKSMRVYGSNNLAGYSCTDPTMVSQIANAIKTETSLVVTCGANTWQYCATQYGGTIWVNAPGGTLCGGSNCSAAGQAMLRPCITFTGVYAVGIDATACNGTAQYGAVEFGY